MYAQEGLVHFSSLIPIRILNPARSVRPRIHDATKVLRNGYRSPQISEVICYAIKYMELKESFIWSNHSPFKNSFLFRSHELQAANGPSVHRDAI
eukprot:scaffold24801_cov181-Cylindrotheca_fusiformis.AAC.10